MNQCLVEINKENGAAIDENGNITAITKSSDEYEFEEILRRENELESKNTMYEKVKKDYEYNKYKNAWTTIFNVTTYSMTIISIVLFIAAGISPTSIVVGSGGIYTIGKLMSLAFGTRKHRKDEKEKLTQEISRLEEEIPRLEEELDDIKEKVKYKEEPNTEESIDYETVFEVNHISNSKVKVKKLGTHK